MPHFGTYSEVESCMINVSVDQLLIPNWKYAFRFQLLIDATEAMISHIDIGSWTRPSIQLDILIIFLDACVTMI